MKCNAACTFAELSIGYDEKGGKFIVHCKLLGHTKAYVGEYHFNDSPDFECKLSPQKFISAAKHEIEWLKTRIAIAKNQEAVSDVR